MNDPILGIDLGTTNSAMAYVNEWGRPQIIPNSEGGRVTPSVVLFDEDGVTVGEQAVNAAEYQPLDVVRQVKRKMGDPTWRHMSRSGREFGPEEISAFILKRLRQDAEQKLGTQVTKAVVTVPAYFDDARRRATQDAGRIAGLDVLRIINEPTAAALAYGIDSGNYGNVLVYDLGGGTFDVTVMQITAGHLDVRFTGGNSQLGGIDWDNSLSRYLNTEQLRASGRDLFEDPSDAEALTSAARRGKHALSNRESTTVVIPRSGQKVLVSREQFEDLTEALLENTRLTTEEVLERAKLSWRDIDRILLVGGSTRMPMVSRMLERVTGKRPSHEVDPDEVVAIGAAMQGALLSTSRDGAPPLVTASGARLTNVKIDDVTAHSLGVEVVADRGNLVNAIVLPAGTTIPARGSRTFYTMVPNQQVWECKVYQGEEENLEWVTLIGAGRIRLTGRYPRNTPMDVIVEYDQNSVVHLYVVDQIGRQPLGELHIERKANLAPHEVERKALEAAHTDVN